MIKDYLKFPIKYFLWGSSYRVDLYVRLIARLKNNHFKMATLVANKLQKEHGVFISPRSQFSDTLKLRHPVAVVIGEGVKIGENVILYQSVTLGGARLGDGVEGNYPEIGDNTVIFSGAAVIGAVKIGKNCIVGANSVVIHDVPDNSTVVGAPAKVIRRGNYD